MNKIINKKAYYEYHIIKEFVAGVKLQGSEVKSLRDNNANIGDTFCFIWNNEVFLKNMYISKYNESSYLNHEERRERKLLLNKKEIKELVKETKEKGITIIPLEIFEIRGNFKVKIGVAKGKKLWDKKEKKKENDIKRQVNRELNDY